MNSDNSSMEERLRAIEDRLALLNLEGEYSRRYDSRQCKAWASLFMEDGIYEGRQLEGMEPQNSVRGRTALEDFCRNEPLHGMHLINVPHLEIDGDVAKGRVHFRYEASGTNSFGRRNCRSVAGYYDVAYVKTIEGWRIRRRVTTYLEMHRSTSYDYEPTAADLSSPPDDYPNTTCDSR